MCGRYSLGLSNEETYDGLEARLPQLFEQGRPRWEREQDHRPRHNVAPRQRATVIHRDSENEGGGAMLEEMQWGLIPHWTKHPASGGLNTINARSEGLLDASSGGMWHALKGYKRCIVPAQGYYEWLKRPSSKIAHFTRHPLTPSTTITNPPLIFFAGLYDHVKYLSPVESRFQPSTENDLEPYPTGNPIPLGTFTILTTTPSKDIEWLHDRMPCILDSWEDVSRWLDLGEMKGWEEGKGGTGDLLRGFPGLDCYPVPPEVGKVGKESPTFIQPVSERSDGIKSFFNKQSPAKPKPAEPLSKAEGKPSGEAKDEEKPEVGGPAKEELESPSNARAGRSVKEEMEVKADPEGIKSEITPQDEEKGLGDDSSAPNPISDSKPKVEDEAPTRAEAKTEQGTREKEEKEETEEKEDLSTTLTKRKRDEKGGAGQRTKVLRKDSDPKSAQPAITNFFKSPGKPKKEELPPRRASTRKKK